MLTSKQDGFLMRKADESEASLSWYRVTWAAFRCQTFVGFFLYYFGLTFFSIILYLIYLIIFCLNFEFK